jgi:hypothetical protein
LEIFEKTDTDALKNISSLPPGIDRAVIGITKTNPETLHLFLNKKAYGMSGFTGILILKKLLTHVRNWGSDSSLVTAR